MVLLRDILEYGGGLTRLGVYMIDLDQQDGYTVHNLFSSMIAVLNITQCKFYLSSLLVELFPYKSNVLYFYTWI